MRRIYKYQLEIRDFQTLLMPTGARVLSVQIQHGRLTLWAEHDVDAVPVQRGFFIVGTGHLLPLDAVSYLATVQMQGFVWHVFESTNKDAPHGVERTTDAEVQ